MSLLDVFQSSKLQSSWSYEADQIIWRLLPTANKLIGESRNIETKQVSFFCLDAVTGKPLWQNLTFEEQWWVSIESVHQNILFFHEFATPDLPDHKRIRAVDLETSKLLWMNDEHQLMFSKGIYAYVSKVGFEQRFYYEVDLQNGSVVREVQAQEIRELQDSLEEKDEATTFPMAIQPGEQIVQGSLAKSLQHAIYSEYIEAGDKLIVAYYEPDEQQGQVKTLVQRLIIADKRGKLQYQETINTGVAYPMPDSFLCMGNFLYFIKNKKILVAVQL